MEDHNADAMRYTMRAPAQTKWQTWIEANVNTWLGFIGSWLITALAMWLLDGKSSIWTISTITVVLCTVWSLARNYFVRRYFDRKACRAAL